MISDKMRWFIKKGMVTEPSCSSFQWIVHLIPGEQPTFAFMSTLYKCELDEAPEYMWQEPTSKPSASPFCLLTKFAIEVEQVCTLLADLSPIPRHKFRTFTNCSGQKFLTLQFEHRMTLVDEVSTAIPGTGATR